MCLIILSFQMNNDFPFILASNRDEYFGRPTAKAQFWEDHPEILAGRDLLGKGTWLGIDRHGRFAALTNYRRREDSSTAEERRSRGLMVSDYLTSQNEPIVFLQQLQNQRHHYQGFNLLLGYINEIWFYSNVENQVKALAPGLYGLSNHLLDTPWPKVVQAKTSMFQCCEQNGDQIISCLFKSLANSEKAPLNLLPNTGIPINLEHKLSPILIEMEDYGTRASTVITMSKNREVDFIEKTIRGTQLLDEVEYKFPLIT